MLVCSQSPEFFHLSKLKLLSHLVVIPVLPTPPSLAPTIPSLWRANISGMTQHLPFGVWPVSLSVLSSRFIHSVTVSEIPSPLRLDDVPWCAYNPLCLSIHSLMDTWVACTFWLLLIMLLWTQVPLKFCLFIYLVIADSLTIVRNNRPFVLFTLVVRSCRNTIQGHSTLIHRIPNVCFQKDLPYCLLQPHRLPHWSPKTTDVLTIW